MNAKAIEVEMNEVLKLANSLSSEIPVAKIVARNVTPWWGGDFETKVIELDSTGRVVGTSLPSVETLKGVMKWVARAAVSSCVEGKYSIKELNEVLAELFGGRKLVRIGNRETQEFYDSIVILKVNAFNDIDRIKSYVTFHLTTLEFVEKLLRKYNAYDALWEKLPNILEAMGWSAFWIQRKDLKKARECLESMFGKKERARLGPKIPRLVDELLNYVSTNISTDKRGIASTLKVYTIPRLKLLLLGKEDKHAIVSILPLPENTVTISVEIRLKKCTRLRFVDLKAFCKFVLLTVIYSLTIHGLGRATTRGFGRFAIQYIEPLSNDEAVRNAVEYVNNLLSKYPTIEFYTKVHEELAMLANQIFKNLVIPQNISAHRNPVLKLEKGKGGRRCVEIGVWELRHPFPYPMWQVTSKGIMKVPVLDILEALSAIGYAMLKNVWKLACGLNPRNPGFTLHTWILGLPRSQKGTGYLINGSEGRRKSPFILFPISSGRSVWFVLIVYRTYGDHLAKISNIEHVGRHRGGEIVVQDLGTILLQRGIAIPIGKNWQCRFDICRNIDDICLDKVYEAARNFIVELLRA